MAEDNKPGKKGGRKKVNFYLYSHQRSLKQDSVQAGFGPLRLQTHSIPVFIRIPTIVWI